MVGPVADTFRLAPSERAGAAERPRKPPRPTPRTAEKPSAGDADTSVVTAMALSMAAMCAKEVVMATPRFAMDDVFNGLV